MEHVLEHFLTQVQGWAVNISTDQDLFSFWSDGYLYLSTILYERFLLKKQQKLWLLHCIHKIHPHKEMHLLHNIKI